MTSGCTIMLLSTVILASFLPFVKSAGGRAVFDGPIAAHMEENGGEDLSEYYAAMEKRPVGSRMNSFVKRDSSNEDEQVLEKRRLIKIGKGKRWRGDQQYNRDARDEEWSPYYGYEKRSWRDERK